MNKRRDKAKDAYALKCGWNVIRLRAKDTLDGSAVNIMKVAVNRPLSVLSTLSGASGSKVMADPLLLRWNYNEWR